MPLRALGRIAPILALTIFTAHAQNNCAGKAQILVLGTYHMANPGHDIYNMQVDDVRAPKRQQELTQLADVLAKFQPTKIAIEADPEGTKLPAAYQDYLAGKHELTQNEIEQIGFRLARQLGHKQLYPVDVDGEFPYQPVVNFAKATGRTAEFDHISSQTAKMVAEEDAFVKGHTVLDSLLYINSPQQIGEAVSFYAQMVKFSDAGDFAGPDLLADWYKRNIRIQGNILRLIGSPAERILVIYGAGHLFWLQENVKMDSSLCLRTLAEFASVR